MVESSTVFLLAFFGAAIVGTPYAVTWLANRTKGTDSEAESYDRYKETYIGGLTDSAQKDVVGSTASIIDYINSRNRRQ